MDTQFFSHFLHKEYNLSLVFEEYDSIFGVYNCVWIDCFGTTSPHRRNSCNSFERIHSNAIHNAFWKFHSFGDYHKYGDKKSHQIVCSCCLEYFQLF
jgi:hypothetical protein